MSQIGDFATLLLDTIRQDLGTALGDDLKVFYDDPDTEQNTPKYAVIDLEEIAESMDAGGGDQVAITFSVSIRVVLARPREGDEISNVVLFKLVNMDRISALLMPGANYAGVFYRPTVPNRRLQELDKTQDDRVEFTMSFQCECTTDHH